MSRTGLYLAHTLVWACVCVVMLVAFRAAFMRFDLRSGLVGAAVGWIGNLVAAVIVVGAMAMLGGCAQAAAAETDCGTPQRAIDLLVSHEIGSPALYTRKYEGLVCPGGASGPTGAIGYDFGHRPGPVTLVDWADHSERARLAGASGVKGTPACRARAVELRDIRITFDHAMRVFERTSIVEYERLARRAFGPANFCAAHPNVRGALVDLVYNRGGSMQGTARAEMRVIRDVCLPRRDRACVAQQLRLMVRVWKGSEIQRTMERRRFDEAALAEA